MSSIRHHIELTPEALFKAEFKKDFFPAALRASLVADGSIGFSPSWKDILGYLGANSLPVVGSGVAAVLAGVCIIPVILVPVITVPIGIASIAGYAGFIFYRLNKKAKEYQVVAENWHGHDIDRDIDSIADTLATLYSHQINQFDNQSIIALASALAKVIFYAMMKNKFNNVDKLANPAVMQHLLLSLADHIPKEKINILLDDGVKRNLRSCIEKSGVFCEENSQVYINDHLKPEKYGVVTFKKRDDLQTFKLFETEKRYEKINNNQKQQLFSHSIFHNNDRVGQVITDSVCVHPFYVNRKNQ